MYVMCMYIFKGEVEAQASFEEISRSPLFSELLQEEEEEPENETSYGYLRKRAVSLQVDYIVAIFSLNSILKLNIFKTL